jgi:hypothetical protein
VAIQELLAEYQRVWNLDFPPPAPEHDDRRRVVEALNHAELRFEACKHAIRGHHKLATKDGSQLGKSFRHVFPPASNGGRLARNRVNSDRVGEFARAGKPPKKRNHKPKPPKVEDDFDWQADLARMRKEEEQNDG